MTRREFEQAAFLEEELALLSRRPQQAQRAEKLRRALREAQALVEGLPDPRARVIAGKVLEHGAPIPWKEIVAELGYRWTVGKARYCYQRVCGLCFPEEGRSL